jgi:cyclase
MFRPRIIPVLLLKDLALVKSVQFRNYQYIGDPINAVRIFNQLEADELVFLDITASKRKRLISLDFVKAVGEESQMPSALVEGSERSEIKAVIAAGAEKVILNTSAGRDPDFVRAAQMSSDHQRSSLHRRKEKIIRWRACGSWGEPGHLHFSPVDFAKLMEEKRCRRADVSVHRKGRYDGRLRY